MRDEGFHFVGFLFAQRNEPGPGGVVNFSDAVFSRSPAKIKFSRPFLRGFAPVRAGAATSQRTSLQKGPALLEGLSILGEDEDQLR